jgi:hypothetical protein
MTDSITPTPETESINTPPPPPPVVDDELSFADSVAKWKIDFIKQFEENKTLFMMNWHLRKHSLPNAFMFYHRCLLHIVRGFSLDDVCEVDQLLAITLGFGRIWLSET